MNTRKFVSLSSLFFFLLISVTGIVLYISPHGRVAYWSDWKVLGLAKETWSQIHVTASCMFLVLGGVHIVLNWGPITAYISRIRGTFSPSRELWAAMFLTVICLFGTFWGLPPFRQIIEIADGVKAYWGRTLGEPPYGHAELSTIREFVQRTGLDGKDVIVRLGRNGIDVQETDTVLAAASSHGLTPKELYALMLPQNEFPPLPPQPPSGLGKRHLEEIILEYGLEREKVTAVLAAEGVTYTTEMTLKEIAEINKRTPIDIYNLLKQTQKGSKVRP